MDDRDFVLGVLDLRTDDIDRRCMIAEMNFKNTGDPRFKRDIELMRSEKYHHQVTKSLVKFGERKPKSKRTSSKTRR